MKKAWHFEPISSPKTGHTGILYCFIINSHILFCEILLNVYNTIIHNFVYDVSKMNLYIIIWTNDFMYICTYTHIYGERGKELYITLWGNNKKCELWKNTQLF